MIWATENKHLNQVKLLLNKGADINIRDKVSNHVQLKVLMTSPSQIVSMTLCLTYVYDCYGFVLSDCREFAAVVVFEGGEHLSPLGCILWQCGDC